MAEPEELAIFKLVEGPAPDGVAFTGVPILRRQIRDKETKAVIGERVELQHVRFVGFSIEDVKAKHAAQLQADRDKAMARDKALREAVEKRAKAREASNA